MPKGTIVLKNGIMITDMPNLQELLLEPRLKRALHNMKVVEEISRKPGYLGDFWERVQRTYNEEKEERARQSMEECKALRRMPSQYS